MSNKEEKCQCQNCKNTYPKNQLRKGPLGRILCKSCFEKEFLIVMDTFR